MKIQRVGWLLGVIAWSMQLIIFLQPFLPGGMMSGSGVCQKVVEMYAMAQPSSKSLRTSQADHQEYIDQDQMGSFDQSHHSMPLMAMNSAEHAKMQQHAPVPLPKPIDHRFSHLSCGFCTLYGHVLPLTWSNVVWLQEIKRPFVTLLAFTQLPQEIFLIDYIKPKSRAPPVFTQILFY